VEGGEVKKEWWGHWGLDTLQSLLIFGKSSRTSNSQSDESTSQFQRFLSVYKAVKNYPGKK